MRHARKAFEHVGTVSNRAAAPMRPFFERFFDRLLPALPTSQELNWGDEVDWARLQQEPLRARRLLRLIVVVVLLLLVWAALAPLDEVTRGEGKVIPSSQVQIVQAVDGGQVKELLVHEGQEVMPGQVLLRIDPIRFTSDALSGRAKILGLKAGITRLQALLEGQPFVVPEDVLQGAPDTAVSERSLYDSSRAEVDSQLSIARQQLTQREEELNETRARHEQAVRSLELAKQELEMTEPLLSSGAVSEVDIIKLKQMMTKLTGDRSQASAQIQKVLAAISEARHKIQDVELNARNKWSKELSDNMTELGSRAAIDVASADKVDQADVRSPVRGTVKRLLVNTINAVVQPGKELVEIVPLDDDLLLEAQVKPRDIAFLRPGLPAKVKITAYDFSIYGGLDGKVEHISADTVIDEKGNAFYLIKVRTDKSTLGDNMPITPGMVAEVDVLTGKKTVLEYLLKPVLRAKANAMTER
ncbi:MAG: HlyD family type I secretion periplasmic adaptor subunit [Azoarcus sp.]|nr:HlyD family type I secretion periplasmic adaptor subunit [Azoarcus sp.]